MLFPFLPVAAGGKKLSVTDATGRVALTATGESLVITNNGTNKAFIELGGATVTAAVDTGFCVLPFSQIVVTRSLEVHTYLAGICDAGETATLYISSGYGE